MPRGYPNKNGPKRKQPKAKYGFNIKYFPEFVVPIKPKPPKKDHTSPYILKARTEHLRKMELLLGEHGNKLDPHERAFIETCIRHRSNFSKIVDVLDSDAYPDPQYVRGKLIKLYKRFGIT